MAAVRSTLPVPMTCTSIMFAMPTIRKSAPYDRFLKSDCTGRLLVTDCTHHSRNVINHHKCKQCIKQTVTSTKEIAEPSPTAVNTNCTAFQNSFIVLSSFDFCMKKAATRNG